MIHNSESFNLLFETSWEVCNKVGGIYTVLSTKANTLQKIKKDTTIFIGPDVWTESNASPYFIESENTLKDWDTNTLPFGLKVRIGRWDIPGKPIAILVNYNSLYSYKNQLYAEMWESFKVDSLHAYGDYDESCMFAYGAALVIRSIYDWKFASKGLNIIAHFDEWTTGMGLLYTKKYMPEIATVFTTHATSIGRSICGNNKPLYEYLPYYNGDQMAQQLNMQSKHSLEKVAAINADCFTTVSSVTALECEQLLERKPDIVTPNGFEKGFVPSKSKFAQAREKARNVLLNVASHLLGHKVADDAFIIATSGRNEFRNKGLDLFIDSINRMRTTNNEIETEVIAFIMVPAWSSGPREDLDINSETIYRHQNPIITHNLHNYSQDAILSKCAYLGMHNNDSENVKVIYIPTYLDGNDGIFNLSYYELLPGVDATAFPSYYEPWGYTPLESIAFGIPTITTDLAGFGQWVLTNSENNFLSCGVKVLHRTDTNYYEVVSELADNLIELAKEGVKEKKQIFEAAQSMAKEASWSNFIEYYKIAYSIALRNNNITAKNKIIK